MSTRKPRLYLAGPISNNDTLTPDEIEDNLDVFDQVARDLRASGYVVENPADNTAPAGADWLTWMRLGLAQLIRCDGVALLPGWEASRGAVVEADLAKSLGLDVREISEWVDDE